MLEPYDENKEVEPYIDQTKEEVLAEFQKILADAQLPENANKDYYQKYKNNPNITIQEWAKDWHGKDIDSEGNLLTTYNPESRWDWYQVGGRWQGMFKLKPDLKYPEKVQNGTASWMNRDDKYEKGYTDQCAFCDIDWEGMQKDAVTRALKCWDETPDNDDYPFSIKKQYKSKRAYVSHCIQFGTYAVLTNDGEWHEPGHMGWWGMSSETEEERAVWDKEFYEKFLKGLPDDTLLSIVDCHI